MTLSASGGTYVRSSATNANQGTDTFLRVNTSPLRTLVRFDQSGIVNAATGMVLLSASLDLFVQSANNWGPGRPVEAHRMSADWTEAGATWNCAIDSNPSNSQPDRLAMGRRQLRRRRDRCSRSDRALVSQYVSFGVTADVAASPARRISAGWCASKTNRTAVRSTTPLARDAGGARAWSEPAVRPARRPPLPPPPHRDGHQHPTRTSCHRNLYAHRLRDAHGHRQAPHRPHVDGTATFTATHTPTVTSTPTPDPNCPPAPLVGCKQPLAASKALLLLKNKGGAGDKLVWKWVKGEARQPNSATRSAPPPTACALSPAACRCCGRRARTASAAWSANSGSEYSDHAAAVAGIKTILLKSGDAGKTRWSGWR